MQVASAAVVKITTRALRAIIIRRGTGLAIERSSTPASTSHAGSLPTKMAASTSARTTIGCEYPNDTSAGNEVNASPPSACWIIGGTSAVSWLNACDWCTSPAMMTSRN